MTCRGCGTSFEPRRQGRPQKYCTTPCRKDRDRKAWKTGMAVLDRLNGSEPGPRGRTPRATEDERVRKAKDRAADQLADYIDQQQREPAPSIEAIG
jgi:hypothetical protein